MQNITHINDAVAMLTDVFSFSYPSSRTMEITVKIQSASARSFTAFTGHSFDPYWIILDGEEVTVRAGWGTGNAASEEFIHLQALSFTCQLGKTGVLRSPPGPPRPPPPAPIGTHARVHACMLNW